MKNEKKLHLNLRRQVLIQDTNKHNQWEKGAQLKNQINESSR